MPVRKSAILIEATKTETTANAGLPAEVLETYSSAMDLAVGLERHSLSVVSRWNMRAIDLAASLAPVVCDLFSLAVKACVELQLDWLSWLPGWQMGSRAGQLDAAACDQDGEQRRNEAAHTMDLAIGAQPAEPIPAALKAAPHRHADQPSATMPVQPAEAPQESAMAARKTA
jgi:hypothetical protein